MAYLFFLEEEVWAGWDSSPSFSFSFLISTGEEGIEGDGEGEEKFGVLTEGVVGLVGIFLTSLVLAEFLAKKKKEKKKKKKKKRVNYV